MRTDARHTMTWLLPWACLLLLASTAHGQEAVLVACSGPGHCAYQRVYAVTLQGKDSVRLVARSAAGDAEAIRKANSVKLAVLWELYREPQSGLVRVLEPDGTLGNVVLPSKLPQGATTAAAVLASSTFEYQTQGRSQNRVSVPMAQFVALLTGAPAEGAVVDFVRRELHEGGAHPFRNELVAGALSFAGSSEEWRAWRGELRTTMQRSLNAFRKGGVDPSRLEAVLNEGLAARWAYRAITPDAPADDAVQKDLEEEQRRFLERVTIAGIFKNAGLHDAFLEEIGLIGLARWSRPELADGVRDSLQASVESHAQLADGFLKTKQYARAFEEASLASRQSPCDQRLADRYTSARVQFVNATAVQALHDYEGVNRGDLEQIVRAIHGMREDELATPEGQQDAKRRIRDGEEMDAHYLPLQFEKAQFLYRIGEYSAARDVVTDVERNKGLGRADVGKWLDLDADIDRRLSAMRQRTEKLANEQIAAGNFAAALAGAKASLLSDRDNPRLLYAAAVAAAVQRDVDTARGYAEQYLRTPMLGCGDSPEIAKNLLGLYRVTAPAESQAVSQGRVPNWMSGESYAPGEVYYDPLSGSFQGHVSLVSGDDKSRSVSTEFTWSGFIMVQSIFTREGTGRDQRVRRQLGETAIEPVYDQKHVYMKAVATGSGTADARRTFPLSYLNAPDFDPILASKFTGKVTTLGWAGNPFFHPFLWEGVYLFALEYDDLRRIRRATPVSDGVSRPSSPFAETLIFTWDGATKRLKSISGTKYRRDLAYDQQGRLVKETIAYGSGKGSIEYRYEGLSRQPFSAVCEDDFYDKLQRKVTLIPQQR